MRNAIHLLMENISQLVTETQQQSLIFTPVFLSRKPSESKSLDSTYWSCPTYILRFELLISHIHTLQLHFFSILVVLILNKILCVYQERGGGTSDEQEGNGLLVQRSFKVSQGGSGQFQENFSFLVILSETVYS